MYASTEDLLKIRDGELVDAKIRAAVDAEPSLQAEVERLREMQSSLRALPAFEPPSGVWERVAAESAIRPASSWHWPLRGVIAATVAAVAILFVMRSPGVPETPLPSTTVVEVPTQKPSGGLTRSLATPAYASLVAESARLERQLNEIGYRPRLINAGTAATITSLEDQIAFIDAQLMYSSTYGLQPRQAEVLQSTRVDLMNALLKVRYAHAQLSGF